MSELPRLTLADFRRAARARLPRPTWDYFRSGADAQVALRENRRAFGRWRIWPRLLVDVATRDLSTTLCGQPLPLPIAIAPLAYQKLAHPDGELATARAAKAAGALLVVSTLATTSLEEVAAAAGPRWFQLYVHKDRGLTRALVERAHAAGYGALVVTADTPLLGRRLADERNGFGLPPHLHMANFAAAAPADSDRERDRSALERYVATRHDASFTWRDLEWLRSLSPLPLVLKGILRGDDAARAVAAGCAAIIVSNHGGRQLDAAPAALDALPEVVAAVGGRAEVLVDGGVRWGSDVLIALALGARAVLLGRPILWGLAVDGERGVGRVLEIARDELSRAMALAGCPSIAAIDRELVRRR